MLICMFIYMLIYIYIYICINIYSYISIPLLSVALKDSYSVTKGGATWIALSGSPGRVPPASPSFQNFPKFPQTTDSQFLKVPPTIYHVQQSIKFWYVHISFTICFHMSLFSQSSNFLLFPMFKFPLWFSEIKFVIKYMPFKIRCPKLFILYLNSSCNFRT